MDEPAFQPAHLTPAALDDPYAPLPPLPLAPAARLAALAPPDPPLLGPLAPGSITLIRGARGAGKSWLALAMARAVAAGEGFLGWTGRSAPVIHVDAAMARAALGARLRALGAAPPELNLIGASHLDLGTSHDQARFIGELPQGGLLVLDGLSLLVPSRRRAAARRDGVAYWLQMMREDGNAILLVEHGSQPQLEALADTLITLKPLREETGVAFTIEIASRNALAAADRAFTVRLDFASGTARWSREAVADPALREIAEAAREGGTVRDMAAALGLSTATAWRRLRRAKALGLVADNPGETDETAAEAPPPGAAPAATDDKRRETGETGPPKPATVTVRSAVQRPPLDSPPSPPQAGPVERYASLQAAE